MSESCQDCRFWNGRDGKVDGWSGHSACRRYPPVNGKHSHGGASAVYPTTQSYHWCGEYQRLAEDQT